MFQSICHASNLAGGIHPVWIARPNSTHYDPRMPALLFWLLVIAAFLFFHLTTKGERRTMVENFWVFMVILGVVAFAWQLIRQGTLSS